MKDILKAVLLLVCICIGGKSMAQVPDAAQLERLQKMAQSLQGLTPDQVRQHTDSILKIAKKMRGIRDSVKDGVIRNVAPQHANGDLVQQYDPLERGDTTYVPVTVSYTYQTGSQPVETVTMNAGTQTAPMITRGKIQTLMVTNMAPDALAMYPPHSNPKYKTAGTSLAGGGNMHYSSGSSGSDYYRIEAGPLDNAKMMMFTFMYNGLQHIASAGLMAAFHCTGGEKLGTRDETPINEWVAKSGGGAEGIGSAITIAGGGNVTSSDIKYPLTITKTPTGYSITGSRHTTDRGQSTTETFTATIGAQPQQWEAVIKPVEKDSALYRKWLPKGQKIDNNPIAGKLKPGDSVRFKLLICDKNDTTKVYHGDYTVKWQLVDVTKYPGICNNYPEFTQHPNTDPDLKFDSMLVANPAFDATATNENTATSKPNRGGAAIVKVLSMDYGAWGKLVATVTLDDGSEPLTARAYYSKNTEHLTIPLDENENKVADAWEKKYSILTNSHGPDWDEDKTPDNHKTGDDISMLDEYRGFVVDSDSRRAYLRTDPTQKDLFVCRAEQGDGYVPIVKRGAALYSKISGITTHIIGNTDMTYKCIASAPGHGAKYPDWINYNSTDAAHHTYAVPIHFELNPTEANGGVHDDGSLPEANTKAIVANTIGAQPPAKTDFVNIFITTIRNVELAPKAGWLSPANPGQGAAKKHLRHAIENFHISGVDTNNLSTLVTQNLDNLVDEICIYSIAHELGHATNMPHHAHTTFSGDVFCPMRYFLSTSIDENATLGGCYENYDRMMALYTLKWDPTTGVWPNGIIMKFCNNTDNCWSKLQLKP